MLCKCDLFTFGSTCPLFCQVYWDKETQVYFIWFHLWLLMILLSVSQIGANAFFHGVLHESRWDDSYFMCTGGFEFVYSCFFLRTISQTAALKTLLSSSGQWRQAIQWHVNKWRFSFLNTEEFVSVFQQRCEHKASRNKSYRLPEVERALWFMSLRTLKRSKRVPLLT